MGNYEFLAEGGKLRLRLMQESDFPLIVKWRNNKRVRDNFIYREEFTLEGQKIWQETMIDTGKVIQLIICEKDNSDRPVGCVYLRDIDRKKSSAEYGIFIGEDDAIGKGYGNESALLMTDYAHSKEKLNELILRAFVSNTSAIKSYEKAGFVKTKLMPLIFFIICFVLILLQFKGFSRAKK